MKTEKTRGTMLSSTALILCCVTFGAGFLCGDIVSEYRRGSSPAVAVQGQQVRPGLQEAVARLRYAYAEALLQDGEHAEARRWFVAAAKLDPEQETDAALRVDEIDGLRIDFDEDEDEDGEPVADAGDGSGADRDDR